MSLSSFCSFMYDLDIARIWKTNCFPCSLERVIQAVKAPFYSPSFIGFSGRCWSKLELHLPSIHVISRLEEPELLYRSTFENELSSRLSESFFVKNVAHKLPITGDALSGLHFILLLYPILNFITRAMA